MGRILEFMSMLFLGMLLVLALTHFLNGTLIEWVGSKFSTHQAPNTTNNQQNNQPPVNVNTNSPAAGAGLA